ncbi:MAG: phospholipid carrier-dependent glycosyltransferase [Gemmatimonadota bacterium]|nr:phospholipid carrier-dependent glycosyltransferase [Gemmatimonadota bacterium]
MAGRSRKKTARAARPHVKRAPFLQRLDSAVRDHSRQVLLVSLFFNLVLCLALFDPKPHTGGDNASYIILAESILRSGDGYSDNITPGPPKPHTQYPFGYSLLLAPLIALAGRSVVLLKLFSVLMAVGSVAVFSRLLRRISPPLVWAALTLAAALNPVIVEYSHGILSEIVFLFFSLLALCLLLESEEEEQGRMGKKFWMALIAVAFTAHIRSAGAGFVIAVFVYYALRRRWRTLAVFTLSMVLLLSPWMIRNRIVRQDDSGYVGQLFMKNPYAPEEGAAGVSDLAVRFIENVGIYSGSEVGRVILGTVGFSREDLLVKIVSITAAILLVAGLIGRLAGGVRVLEVYLIVYFGVVLIWPEVWSDVRFILPVAPLILYYTVQGAVLAGRLAARGLKKESFSAVAAAAALAIALTGLTVQLKRLPDNTGMLGKFLRGDRYAGYPVNWRYLYESADWVRENTPETSVVTVRKPRLFYLHTGRRVDGYPFTTDTDSVLARICATDYVVIDAVSGTTYRYLVPAVQKDPGRFKMVFRRERPFTGVLEVVR